jgi:hypothetical protein
MMYHAATTSLPFSHHPAGACEMTGFGSKSGCDTLPENRQKVRLKMRHLNQVSQTRWRMWSMAAKRALRQAALAHHTAQPHGVANWRLFDLFCATAPLAPPPLGVWGGGANSGSHHHHHQDTRALQHGVPAPAACPPCRTRSRTADSAATCRTACTSTGQPSHAIARRQATPASRNTPILTGHRLQNQKKRQSVAQLKASEDEGF